MNRRVGAEAEPEVRIGHCCGCHADPMALYKIPGLQRYRCADCYEKEMGYRHWLSPPKPLRSATTDRPNDYVIREMAELGVTQ